MGPSARVVMAPEERLETPWLGEVLDTLAEFGEASIGLVAWELSLREEALAPAWRQAFADGLIEEVGRCPETAERMYRLVPVTGLEPPGLRSAPSRVAIPPSPVAPRFA
jgi:hypothetical protein